ncbi:TRAP dicarboxylate transporter subunit DctP [Pusillimonas sp. T7-7]|uniref:TRAP transporter substrate-binding protein n=1 Tax=Pusillimonas sp. (strain T7-7) TaxID=1007105 RepID=UPI00020850BA|nr:DctP family TRAP transporter solute-binding subunit [Pusillimonas sp. T7-7]AEC21838.1 TRAP dicarboxylate transporter subunit DctP [Pusillimonas sp. T7-7]
MLSKLMASIAAVTTVLILAATSPVHAEKTIKINLAHGGDPVHPWNTAAKQFAKEVQEKSNGALTVRIYTAGQMGSDREMLESTQSGALQMSAISTMAMSGFEPSLQIFDLPYLMPSYELAYKVLDGEIGQEVAEKLKKKGVRNLAYWENDYRQLSNSKKPIVTVEDVAGLKIRVPETPILISWLEALKAIPTPIAYTELYTSLQQGVVDGQDNGIFLMHSAKYYEVQKYYTLTNHIYAPVAFLINERFFNKLSGEQQQIIQEAAEHARDYQRSLSKDLRNERLSEMKQAGLEVTELSPEALQQFRESAQPVYEKMKSVVDERLLQKILDLK